MSDIEKLATQILDEIEAHGSSIEEAIRRELATPEQKRATLISLIERHLRALAQEAPTGSIRRYRVWFDTFYYSLGFIVGTLPENAVNIEGVTKEGIVIEAYTAADVVEQAKFEIHALTYNLAGGPYQTVIRKIAPDRGVEREAVKADAYSDGQNRFNLEKTMTMHMPGCDGQCGGDCVRSPQHG